MSWGPNDNETNKGSNQSNRMQNDKVMNIDNNSMNGNNFNNGNNNNGANFESTNDMAMLMALMSNLDLTDYRQNSKNREYLQIRLANDLKRLGYLDQTKETVNKLVDIISAYL